jgi:hypothetical protein
MTEKDKAEQKSTPIDQFGKLLAPLLESAEARLFNCRSKNEAISANASRPSGAVKTPFLKATAPFLSSRLKE